MDHDVLSYEASTPIEIGMQFAYETVIYETLNYSIGDAKDVSVNFDEIFQNTLTMPETPVTVTTEAEGSDGTSEPDYDWTKLSTSIPDEQSARTVGTGTNTMTKDSVNSEINSTDAAYGGGVDLRNISSSPVSDAIDKISSEVYNTTKSAVSSFSAGGKSGGSNNTSFFGGLGDKFASMGPGDGRYNPDSKNYRGKNSATNVSANGKIIKNKNGNVSRKGTSSPTGGGASYR